MENEKEVNPKCNNLNGSLSQKKNSPKKMPAPYYSKTNKKSKPETASSVLIKYLLDNENNCSKTAYDMHPIDTFFSSLAVTTKTFSPEYQHMTKNKFFFNSI